MVQGVKYLLLLLLYIVSFQPMQQLFECLDKGQEAFFWLCWALPSFPAAQFWIWKCVVHVIEIKSVGPFSFQ